jgi:hypothetical protein
MPFRSIAIINLGGEWGRLGNEKLPVTIMYSPLDIGQFRRSQGLISSKHYAATE